VLRSEIPSSICAKLHTVAASNKRSCVAISLTIACLPSVYNGVIVHAHPVCGESHNQRNTTGEVATTFPPFYNKPHRLHVLCVKAELGTTFTSWSPHHFVAIGNPEQHMRKASHRGSKQQQRSCVAISLTIACLPSVYNGVIVHAHPVRGESHNQCNTTGKVATIVSI